MGADYLDALREAFPNTSDLDLELKCSTSRDYRELTYRTATQHRRAAMEILFPSRVWHEWREERIESVQECLEGGIQELMWMGAASSGKTHDMADVLLTLWWQNPAYTTIYVTSPFDDATEKGLWAVVQEQFHEAKAAVPSLPGIIRKAQSSIVLNDRTPRSFIRKVSMDEVGKMKGKKAIDVHRGLIVLAVNELPDFPATAAESFLKVLWNLRSNRNLLIFADGNFTNIADAFGIMCAPDIRDIPNGYHGFNPDKHFRWRTNRRGLCLRFDGLQSPNVKAGADIYPFLTRLDFIASHAEAPGGLDSPHAMREIRSAPVTSLDEFTVTNGERITAGGCYDTFKFTGEDVEKIGFCDAGLGGDPCAIQKARVGYIEGNPRRQVLELWGPPHIIPVRINTGIPVEDQVALGMKEHFEAHGIPPENTGYDAALRPALAQKIGQLYSVRSQAIDSNGPPTDRKMNASQKMTWKEKVDRLVTEYWFAMALMIDSGQLRGLGLSPKAVEQLCTRRWSRQGKRDRLDTKLEYKALLRAMGKPVESPNEADALAGCVELARRLGMIMQGATVKGGALDLILRIINERQSRIMAKEIMSNRTRPPLPTGRLHAITPPASYSRVRLNRH